MLRRFSVAALLTAGAFCAGVLFGWMLNENGQELPNGG